MSIIIFSRPVRSGKTTELQRWCDHLSTTKNIGGVLMPDINGCRQFFDIQSNEHFDAECKEVTKMKDALLTIGNYHFYNAGFQKANAIIAETAPVVDLLVIDEVGKLELEGKGLYEGIIKVMASDDYKNGNKTLLLVVRDSLYDAVISFFKIADPHLVHQLNDIRLPKF